MFWKVQEMLKSQKVIYRIQKTDSDRNKYVQGMLMAASINLNGCASHVSQGN